MNGLFLHCGSQTLERGQLDALSTPAGTRTHRPIGHGDFLGRIIDGLERQNCKVVSDSAGVSKDGGNAFGMLHVQPMQTVSFGDDWTGGSFLAPIEADDYGLAIGWRNSHKKQFSAQLAVGAGVFVCDNMMFCGETKIGRKHTLNILNEIDGKIDDAIRLMLGIKPTMDARIEHYKEEDITVGQCNDLIVRSIRDGIVPGRSAGELIKECDDPKYVEFRDWNAWSMFNCFTEILKTNVQKIPERTQKLCGMFDREFGFTGRKTIETQATLVA